MSLLEVGATVSFLDFCLCKCGGRSNQGNLSILHVDHSPLSHTFLLLIVLLLLFVFWSHCSFCNLLLSQAEIFTFCASNSLLHTSTGGRSEQMAVCFGEYHSRTMTAHLNTGHRPNHFIFRYMYWNEIKLSDIHSIVGGFCICCQNVSILRTQFYDEMKKTQKSQPFRLKWALRIINSCLAYATVNFLFISCEIIPHAPLEKCVESDIQILWVLSS